MPLTENDVLVFKLADVKDAERVAAPPAGRLVAGTRPGVLTGWLAG